MRIRKYIYFCTKTHTRTRRLLRGICFVSLWAPRQLEAVVRIAESLAKMKLQAVAGEEEVDEALRLFQVSTLDAALSGSLSGLCHVQSLNDVIWKYSQNIVNLLIGPGDVISCYIRYYTVSAPSLLELE